jgi:hypothetical protein
MSTDIGNKSVGHANSVAPERRRHPRFPLVAHVEAFEPKSNMQISGRTSDISLEGCYVDTINPFSEGAVIRITLTRDKLSYEANATVVFSQVGMGMGVTFTSAEKKQFQIYQKWIDQLGGNLSPEPDVLEQETQGHGDSNLQEEKYYVLAELVIALMRKEILTEVEGKAMLMRLHR